MESLLGPNLLKNSETVPTSSIVGGDDHVVGLYFSAHWCPPCRAFTPVLSTFYTDFKKTENGSKFDLVFVSSDRDLDSFQEYYGSMTFHALPYEARDIKAKLTSKFKVTGIPTLILLDAATGNVINKNGRSVITNDKEGKNFPWRLKQPNQILAENDGALTDKSGGNFTVSEALAGKVTGLYFSAHWCPPCRAFTPLLVKTYEKLVADGKNFEVIFCSGDNSPSEFKEYLNEMPWKALPFQDKRQQELSNLMEVNGIPHLVILDEEGQVITNDGRSAVTKDPNGEKFPWRPQPIEELDESMAHVINDSPCIIVFTDGSEDKIGHAKSIMTPQAEIEYAKGISKKEIYFFWGGEDDICSSIRDFCNLEDEPENLVILLDIPGQKIHVVKEAVDTLTAESVEKIIREYRNDTLDRRSIR